MSDHVFPVVMNRGTESVSARNQGEVGMFTMIGFNETPPVVVAAAPAKKRRKTAKKKGKK